MVTTRAVLLALCAALAATGCIGNGFGKLRARAHAANEWRRDAQAALRVRLGGSDAAPKPVRLAAREPARAEPAQAARPAHRPEPTVQRQRVKVALITAESVAQCDSHIAPSREGGSDAYLNQTHTSRKRQPCYECVQAGNHFAIYDEGGSCQ